GSRPPQWDAGSRSWGVMRGSSWFWGGRAWNSVFNASLLPNDPALDCGAHGRGFFAARSNHSGGGNVALGGGRVRFIANGVSLATWQAPAPPAGHDLPGAFLPAPRTAGASPAPLSPGPRTRRRDPP